ncbi:hypothetical protein [Rummeliibacillus stabekisii]|uniref:hypothetical protein n=1 Tax=Rummeliibacillus stabekisii TaxID=241244 RepID=UPI0011735457|nr:hypothetical protein [Rummeliibacillus stabekisii]MBB5171606.1 hypothetical protein [Rummeliibacillus stabekisii]GEL05453.1 hypothetical protein RST01_20800 [Rummeliibacillus stabekisii]
MLKSVCGTGEQILNNFAKFHYCFLNKEHINEVIFYTFKVEYIDKLLNSYQNGHLVIGLDLNNKIKNVNLNIDNDEKNFVRTLGSNNDNTLLDLSEKIIDSYYGLI